MCLMTTRKVSRPKIHGKRIQFIAPPPLNTEVFRELYFAFYKILYNDNMSGTARALDISINTAKGWIHTPPKNAHTNVWLKHVLMEQIKYAQHHKTKEMRTRAAEALQHINTYAKSDFRPTADPGVEVEAEDIDTGPTVARFLLEIVSKEGPMSTTKLRGGRFSHTSPRTYRRAADQLCLDRLTRGFGDDKETWYFLPGDEQAIPESDHTNLRSH